MKISRMRPTRFLKDQNIEEVEDGTFHKRTLDINSLKVL